MFLLINFDCLAVASLYIQGTIVIMVYVLMQLAVARKFIDYHTDKFGYSKPNVEFREGYIENLNQAGLEDETFNVIV